MYYQHCLTRFSVLSVPPDHCLPLQRCPDHTIPTVEDVQQHVGSLFGSLFGRITVAGVLSQYGNDGNDGFLHPFLSLSSTSFT
ncbi:hypothetical protein BDF14DRAFT_1774661 [Spinellus fusiger]|nr:hypothetical protein BDF14DRAFT_1774661 [Spinellus fusiger]